MRNIRAGTKILIGTVGALIALLFGTAPSLAQIVLAMGTFPQDGPTYSVCIGDYCSSDFNFPCSFAYANATNPDQAAASQICQHRLGGTPIYQRVGSRSGGQCGITQINVTCPGQALYNVCIGQIRNNCRVAGLYGALDYAFPCSFAYAHATNTDQAAASQICQAKGWPNGTAVRVQSYSGNQCGYITAKVTCHF